MPRIWLQPVDRESAAIVTHRAQPELMQRSFRNFWSIGRVPMHQVQVERLVPRTFLLRPRYCRHRAEGSCATFASRRRNQNKGRAMKRSAELRPMLETVL